MLPHLSPVDASPKELRDLVKSSVFILGKVILRRVGPLLFQQIEDLRKEMSSLRSTNAETGANDSIATVLDRWQSKLDSLSTSDRRSVARAYTLMLELMNACENAYRSHRLGSQKRNQAPEIDRPKAVIYVMTSHPTEARSPQSIAIFDLIQTELIYALNGDPSRSIDQRLNASILQHHFEIAWRVSVTRSRKPSVQDEADHLYSILFRPKVIETLLKVSQELVPVYLRTWVGGDKDGHPGVDQVVMQRSLQQSRAKIYHLLITQLGLVHETLKQWPSGSFLEKRFQNLRRSVLAIRTIRVRDGSKIQKLRLALMDLVNGYQDDVGSLHPSLILFKQILHAFPGLVVPLELRESSDVLMGREAFGGLAMDRMLIRLAQISGGGDPRWYARGLIVSMTQDSKHLERADQKIRLAFGRSAIPVIPLFEQIQDLTRSVSIIESLLVKPKFMKVIREQWDGVFEVMVGYSDSAKEGGVFPSRLAIAKAMNDLDQLFERYKVRVLFFQGSGGSVDRGGGAVKDQTSWWPKSAVQVHKVTLQGEMIERSLSTPEIARGQIERIVESASLSLRTVKRLEIHPTLQLFSDRVSETYRKKIESKEFLRLIEFATPYSQLSELKIGSRPTRRSAQLSVKGLRAIPWVLCWTQTRVLFPTWWGIGSAWASLSNQQKSELQLVFQGDALFSSFVRALGFTLAKVELEVWRSYLMASGLAVQEIASVQQAFDSEFQGALKMLSDVSGQSVDRLDPLWFQPWLGASIRLRAPMIHPLNLLQILAIRDNDLILLRLSVTGISSGMLTTG